MWTCSTTEWKASGVGGGSAALRMSGLRLPLPGRGRKCCRGVEEVRCGRCEERSTEGGLHFEVVHGIERGSAVDGHTRQVSTGH